VLAEAFTSVLPSFAEWWRVYLEVTELLGIDKRFDEFATAIAYELVKSVEPPLDSCRVAVMGREAIVFGAGPSLEAHLKALELQGDLKQKVLIAADGATAALVEVGIVPHVVVTDLDGNLNAILYAAAKGAKLFVHIHGDNVEQFTEFIEELKRAAPSFAVTTQVVPRYPVLNVGGFTDGDRAYSLALAFRASRVLLAGMDFGDVVGRYSKPWLKSHEKASPRKAVKLLIALKIVSALACLARIPTLTLSDTVPTCVEKALL
jgi:uncharacterized Rossmann fold enzyme